MGTLYVNGLIRTMAHEEDVHSAMFVEKTRIIAMGEEGKLRRRFGRRIDQIQDLNGKAVYPAFTDAHIHLIGYGEAINRVDASRYTTLEALGQAFLKAEPINGIHVAEGYDETKLDRAPTKAWLNQLFPDAPALLKRTDRHTALVNDVLFQQLGYKASTVIDGGKIGLSDNGEADGFLYDAALEPLYALQAGNLERNKSSLRSAIKSLYQYGIIAAHTEDLSYHGDVAEVLQAYKEVTEETGFHTHLLVHHLIIDEFVQQQPILPSTMSIGAMKLFVDGALGGRTALLGRGYSDDPTTRGIEVHTPEQLEQLVKRARSYGFTVAAHVIGDLAIERFVQVLEKYPAPKGKRDRIIHATVVRPETLARIRKLPVLIDVQPVFLLDDADFIVDRLGLNRLDWSYRLRSLAETGALLCGGADAPISDPDVRRSLYAATEGTAGRVNKANETLSMYEALLLFTKNPHLATETHGRKGLLLPGYDADFVIFEEDFYRLRGEAILNNRLVKTVQAGKIVYQAEATLV
ncbi:amidohydrolase [Exiguobacterium sp. Leaf196]|uniref:amidohydrolase n=1 Tax=Exiguobacterium sp. Leaf196 TaxID=1736298 RepID=UPI0006F4C353|nr:amidohydrolase [Exiguobacterium sp. Leaf196]KQS40444.1 amidohydrolase [Exiguobacterium sp. Leaf196]